MTDPRLGRLEHFDIRSRAYPVTLPPKPLRSYTWRGGPVTDQGREGACVGHGWTGELTARPKPVHMDKPDEYAHFLYRRCQQIDPWPGDDYDGTSVLAGAQELKARRLIGGYEWAFTFDAALMAIAYRGPVVLGIPWYDSMYEAAGGTVRVGGSMVGGHCILARGVSLRRRSVLLRNSWGKSYGIGGDAWIGFDDLRRLLREDGEAVIPTGRAL